MTRLRGMRRIIIFISITASIVCCSSATFAQQGKKLRPLRIALPSNTVGATHFYVGKSLGIFESYGFEPQILVLEPRAALAALLTGDLDFYTATEPPLERRFAAYPCASY